MPNKTKKPCPELELLDSELSELKILLAEILKNFQSRIVEDIDRIRETIKQISAQASVPKQIREDLFLILNSIKNLSTKPERGRRKDIKKIEDLICEIQTTTERW